MPPAIRNPHADITWPTPRLKLGTTDPNVPKNFRNRIVCGIKYQLQDMPNSNKARNTKLSQKQV